MSIIKLIFIKILVYQQINHFYDFTMNKFMIVNLLYRNCVYCTFNQSHTDTIVSLFVSTTQDSERGQTD